MNATYDYTSVFLWGLVVFASLVGYGRGVARSIGMASLLHAGWGLHAVWGLGVVLWLGGVSLWAGVFSRTIIDALVTAGLVLLAMEAVRAAKRDDFHPSAWLRDFHPSELLPWAVLLVLYAGGVAWLGETDRNDDLVSYFAFPRIMLETGTFHEPFAFRRMTTHGGQPFLQALTTRFGSEMNLHFADCALARLLLFGLLRGALQPLRMKRPVVFAALATSILLLPIPRNNTTSELIHAVLLLAVPLTLRVMDSGNRVPGTQSRSKANVLALPGLALSGLVIFAASTFRPHIGFAAAVLFSAGSLAVAGPGLAGWRRTAPAIAMTGFVVVALLLPWAAMLHGSSGSLAFPPLRGNLSPAFASMHAFQGTTWQALRIGFDFLSRRELIALGVPLLLFAIRGPRRLRFASLGAIALSLLTTYASTALSFPYFHRYVWPIPFAALVFCGCMYGNELVARANAAKHPNALKEWAFGAAAFALAIGLLLPKGVHYLGSVARDIGRQIEAPPSPIRVRNEAFYRAAQNAIPEGARVIAMTDLPYLFDHARNRIMTIDAPGALSPDGKMPFFQGPDVMRQYLLEHGIEYFAYTPPERAILQYRRDYWENNPRPEAFYRTVWAPPMLDLMNHVRDWRTTQPTVAEFPRVAVLDLREGAAR